MKKLFLIPLMTMLCTVMAWATDVHVSSFSELKSAVETGSATTIYLDKDIEYRDAGANKGVNITRSLTIDGQGHSLTGYAGRNNATNGTLISLNHGLSDATAASYDSIDVTIKNLTIVEEKLRAIETRGKVRSLTIENSLIKSTGAASGTDYPQALTIGGKQYSLAKVTIINSIIDGGSHYPVISFNPYHLTASNTEFKGYCGLYFKGIDGSAGSYGSIIDADGCNFNSPNVYSGSTDAFAVFPLEDAGITFNLHNCGMNAQKIGSASQDVFLLSPYTRNNRRSGAIVINLSGDNSHYNTSDNLFDNQWYWAFDGSSFSKVTSEETAYEVPIQVIITGGTYSVHPDSITYAKKIWINGQYLNGISDTVKVPDTHEVQEVKQGGVTLYRVVKKAQEKTPGVMYDLNDFVPVEGVDEGNNPISSFDLSTGTGMTLNNEVTTAGYVQVSDNEDSGVATTVTVGQTAGGDDQTLVINNGLDVQGDSKVEVEPGASLIIGEGGINTEKPENIVLEVTEDAGAAILLDPTITINKNPNLTVKLTTNSKQLTASPWTYVYQRFAIPVQVGIVPTNDFDGELFPGNTSFKNYVFEWNGYDWVTCSSWGALEPFKGYQLANNSKNGGVTYTFTGQLVGNDNSVYNFPTGGFDFFGNSHLAPIYIDSLLKPYESQAVEASVWLYNYDTKNFEAITSEDIADGLAFATEIKPMEGFILNYHGASGSAGMNYASAIWGNPKFDAAIGRPSQSNPVPARNRVSETSNRAIINVVAENGQGDNVKLVEKETYSAEFENGADASKFVYDNAVSIYASTENGELSRVATNDLTGTLLSFNSNDATNYTITLSNVLGEDYALRDNVTGQTIAFAEGATYTFTQAANTTVPARFEVISAAKMPTALDNVEEAAKVSGIYTITGQYLGHDFTNLPAGVYIVNGVKIVK